MGRRPDDEEVDLAERRRRVVDREQLDLTLLAERPRNLLRELLRLPGRVIGGLTDRI